MVDNKVKSGFVSIIGLPNAGKSTLLNVILKEKIAITSKKPQTTRKNLKGIYNDEESQIVFVDTPGIHSVKNELDNYMDISIKKSIDDIDMIIAIVDIMTYEKDDFKKMILLLNKSNAKKILVINKVDVYRSCESILTGGNNEFIELSNDSSVIKNIITKFENIEFENIFQISALKRKNIDKLISYIKENLKEGMRYYEEDNLTDEPTKQIIADMIRKHCLYKLDKEIPHGIVVIVDSMKISQTKCMNIYATIICEKDTHKGIIIGKNGTMIKNIGTGARIEIEKFIKNKVNLKLNVIVKKNWRDEKTLVANFGYDKNKI